MVRKTAETLSRQWVMLKHIPAWPNSRSTKEIHQYLVSEGHETDLRTTQRDLDRLCVDFPLTSIQNGRANHWQWGKGAHALEIPSMTPSTALVFKLVEQYLKPLLPNSTLALIKPYLERATEIMKTTHFQGWRKNVRMLNRGPRLITPPVKPAIRDVVYTALMENRQFTARYRSRKNEKPIVYTVNPLGLVIRDGISYVISTLWGYDDLKHLALHRIQSASITDNKSRRIRGFDLDRYIEQESSFAYPVTSGELKLKVRFDQATAYHLHESKLSLDQVLKPNKGGKL